MSASAPHTESTMMTRSKESASSNTHNGLELLVKATHIIRSKSDSSDQYSSDKISGTDSGNEGSAKTSGSNSSTPVMSSNCSIRTRASTGVISGSINKTDIKSEGCPSPSSDTCSSRSGTPQSFKRTRGKIDDLYIVQIPPKKQKIGRNDGTGVNNKNDYFCWICHRDGVMIFCELCPRVYHIKCLGLEESPSEWVCPECERIMRAECVDTRSKSMSMITQEQFCALLKHALTRMKHQTSSPFRQPVDLCAVPNYHDFIYHPMDLTTIEKNIKNDKYGSTEAFLADVKWILHNCIIFNGTHHKLTGSAKMILKICKHEMTEIEICPDCYARSCEQTTEEWFCEPCNNPHRIVWAKLKGYPFWPAKALREKNGMVDVRFFGAHDRSWVPISQVYAYSKECPTVMRSKRSGFDYSMSELKRYIEKYKEKFGSFEYAPFRTLYDSSSPYLEKSGKNSPKIKSLQIYPSPASSNSPDANVMNQKKKQSTKGVSEKMSEKVSVITKTASAVKNKYSSIITTRRGALMKMMQQTSSASTTTTASSTITTTTATVASKETTSQKESTTTVTTTATTTAVTSTTTTKDSPKPAKLKAKRTISSTLPLPKKRAIPGVFFPSDDSCSELPEKSSVKVCMESVGNVDDKICGKSTIPPLLNIKREPGLEDEEVANSLILNNNSRNNNILTSSSLMEGSSSKRPEKLIAPNQIKQERESPVDIIQTGIPPQKSSKESAATYSQNFHRMVKNNSLSISASGNAHSKDGEISAHQKTVEIISPVLTTKKGKANSSTNGHLFEGENKMSIVQSPQKRNTLKSVSDSNSLSAFRPPPKNQNTIPDIQRTLSDPQMTVMEPNSSSCEIAKSSNRKILMPKIGSLSAINRRSLEDCSTDSENSKSNLSLPTATTEATLLLGLLKNKINSNVNSASTSSCSTTSGPVSGGSSNPARNDISRPVEINQLVEKYTKQLSKNIQESFEEMYADMLTKHSHQVIMKHYHQELEKLRWIHEQEIAEIKHNTNLIVAEIRASWENEKERYGNSIREQCEIEKIKSVEETKKKQWCANCGKEALLYCCWNTSYCDYQCQANHWPQHMTSCTQQLPQSTQVTQLTVPTPVMTTATSNPSGTLVNPAPQGVVALSEVLTKTNNSNTTTPVVIPNLRQQQQQPPLPPPQQQPPPPPPPPPPVSTNAQLPEIKSVETLNTTATPKFSTRASGMLQQIVKKEEIRPKMMNLQPVSTTVSGPTQIQFVPTSLAQSTGGSIQVLPAPSTQLLSRNPIPSPSHHLQLQYVQSAQHFQTYAAASGQTPVRMQTVQLQSASLPSTLQGQSSFPSIIANPQPVVATAAISSTTNTKMNTITVPTVTSSAPKNIKPNATTKNILIPPGSFILTKAPQGQLQLNAKQM